MEYRNLQSLDTGFAAFQNLCRRFDEWFSVEQYVENDVCITKNSHSVPVSLYVCFSLLYRHPSAIPAENQRHLFLVQSSVRWVVCCDKNVFAVHHCKVFIHICMKICCCNRFSLKSPSHEFHAAGFSFDIYGSTDKLGDPLCRYVDAVAEARIDACRSLLDEFEGILAGVHCHLCDGNTKLL